VIETIQDSERRHSTLNGYAGHTRAAELDAVIENVSGFGLRLNCSAQVVRSRDEIIA
jgi:hypothetical protein